MRAIQVISTEVLLLRDRILAEARARGVALEEHSLALEHGLPVLRLRLGATVLRGCWVRFPGRLGRADVPDVITVHGSGFRASRMWPRRRDQEFNIDGVVTHVLHQIAAEAARSKPPPTVEAGVPSGVSGLHVVHVAALHFGTLLPGTTPTDILALIHSPALRRKIDDHAGRDVLSDADLRILSDKCGMFFGRAVKIDFDPFQTMSDRFLRVLRIGSEETSSTRWRHILVLDVRRNEILVADPAGAGLTTIDRRALERAWARGARQGSLWLGTLGPKARDR